MENKIIIDDWKDRFFIDSDYEVEHKKETLIKNKDMIHKRLGLIIYYIEKGYLPMYEDCIYTPKDLDYTFIEYINKYFKLFLKEEKLSYSIENFLTFEMINYDFLLEIFKKYKIDYILLKDVKEYLFKFYGEL